MGSTPRAQRCRRQPKAHPHDWLVRYLAAPQRSGGARRGRQSDAGMQQHHGGIPNEHASWQGYCSAAARQSQFPPAAEHKLCNPPKSIAGEPAAAQQRRGPAML